MDGAASVSRAVLLVERRRVAISRRHRGVPFDVLIAISSGRRPESIAAKIAEVDSRCSQELGRMSINHLLLVQLTAARSGSSPDLCDLFRGSRASQRRRGLSSRVR